ncbi:MAG: BON domain-containing protein [Pseudobdellovibrionaceae bacterium]|nr:BON domain-containing protein [Pseudobdellovibrionaceae bacterium]
MKTSLVLTLMASSVLLAGCGAVGLATGVGAAVGVSAAKEGGIRGTVTDESIRLEISDLWFRRDVDMFRKLNLNVNQGRVLVTGVVQNPEDRVEAIRLAWQPTGVKQVINEIRVGDSSTIASYAKDTWISGQLRTQITFDKYIQSINYSIETVHGSVYLMGVAQSQEELDRVVEIARRISGVKEVISYVKFLGNPVGGADPVSGNAVQGATVERYESGQEYQNAPTPLASSMDGNDSYGGAQSPESVPYSYSSGSSIQSEVLPP